MTTTTAGFSTFQENATQEEKEEVSSLFFPKFLLDQYSYMTFSLC